MKKFVVGFVVCAVILAALGSAGFFLGWAQAPVPAGSYGVVRSKTHGVDKRLVHDGETLWLWYKLIPANAKTLVFTPKPYTAAFTVEGKLPQAEHYAVFMTPPPDFNWQITGTVSFSVNPESLPGLVESENIDSQNALDIFAGEALDAARIIAEKLVTEIAGEAEKLNGAAIAGSVQRELEAEYPYLDSVKVEAAVTKTPDYGLYSMLRDLYADYIEKQRRTLDSLTDDQARAGVLNQFEYDRLERYGELLEKYPKLLDLLIHTRSAKLFDEERP